MQYDYLNEDDSPTGGAVTPVHDMGIRVTGPIAQETLRVFDSLWEQARACRDYDCRQEYTTEAIGQIPHAPEALHIYRPDNATHNVFSLFRDDNDKTSDQAIVAALQAASNEIHILQNHFFENTPPYTHTWSGQQIYFPLYNHNDDNGPMPYSMAIVEAATRGVPTQLLLSGGNLIDLYFNLPSFANLRRQIAAVDPQAVQYVTCRLYQDQAQRPVLHSKALAVDDRLLMVGTQNFQYSAFGDLAGLDLAEYNLAVDDATATADFEAYFEAHWAASQPCFLLESGATLQSAIAQAPSGGVVFVPAGVYTETVVIDKPLTVLGQAADQVIVHAPGNAPAFRITSSEVTLAHMTIRAGQGYGIELHDTSPHSLLNVQLTNLVLVDNQAGGVLVTGHLSGSPLQYTLENNTFVGGAAGLILDVVAPQVTPSVVRNNLFAGQTLAPVLIVSATDGGVTYQHNLFANCPFPVDCQENWKQGRLSPISTALANVFASDPQFAAPEAGNYRLTSTSPALDAGDPQLFHALVRDGNGDGLPRIDIGAFEFGLTMTEETPAPRHDAPNAPEAITRTHAVNVNWRYFINPMGDEDWLRFELPTVGGFQVHLTSLPVNYDVYVYDAAGQLWGSSTKSGKAAELVRVARAPAGYYYVRVVGVNGTWDADNPYQLRFTAPGVGGPR